MNLPGQSFHTGQEAYVGQSKKPGRTFQTDFVMVFTLKDGKVVRFREYLDAETVNAAF